MFFIHSDDVDFPRSKFAMVSLNRSDRLRLLNFDSEVETLVSETITMFYQSEQPPVRDYHGSTEFKLKGFPFSCKGEESIQTRKLICRLLEALSTKGWTVLTTLDITRKVTDKSVFIMEKNNFKGWMIFFYCLFHYCIIHTSL